MHKTILQKYLFAFSRLKRGVTKYGPAPHKPILLITLIELIRKGTVLDNRFEVNSDLVGLFQENWQLLVDTANQPDFTQPFYYLQSDKIEGQPFWKLCTKTGVPINAHIKSVNTLADILDYGALVDDLFLLLTNPVSNQLLMDYLIETFFSARKKTYYNAKQNGVGYYKELEDYVLNDPTVKYKNIKIETEEEVFVRCGLFKRYIPQLYQSTCAFTGMKLTSTFRHSFIDACHIVPFSVSQNDKVTNGIALCPNMHRAFDRGLLSITPDFRIKVSSHIYEDESHDYSLKRLMNKPITLPATKQYWPSQDNLEWHNLNVFK